MSNEDGQKKPSPHSAFVEDLLAEAGEPADDTPVDRMAITPAEPARPSLPPPLLDPSLLTELGPPTEPPPPPPPPAPEPPPPARQLPAPERVVRAPSRVIERAATPPPGTPLPTPTPAPRASLAGAPPTARPATPAAAAAPAAEGGEAAPAPADDEDPTASFHPITKKAYDQALAAEEAGDIDGALKFLDIALRRGEEAAVVAKMGMVLAFHKKEWKRGQEMVRRAGKLKPNSQIYKTQLNELTAAMKAAAKEGASSPKRGDSIFGKVFKKP